MTLTPTQLTTLRTAVLADPVAAPLMQAGNLPGLMAWLNAPSGAVAWRPLTPASDADEAPSYASYDTLSQGKRDSWVRFLAAARDYRKGKIRNWIVDVWGAATAASNSELILQAGTEPYTNAQVVFGGTVKKTGTVSATHRNWEDLASYINTSDIIFNDDGTIRTS